MDAVASMARLCGLFDTHCHLQTDFLYSRLKLVVEDANKAGVRRMATAGCEVGDWQQTLDIAHQFKEQGVLAGLGIHPFTVVQPTFASSNWEELLTSHLERNKEVFVGEIGLDAGHQYKSYLPQQEVVLQKQLELAVRFDRPAVIHCVRAPEKLSTILHSLGATVEKSSPGGNPVRLGLHWYSGSSESMKRLLKLTSLEIYFSFTGASVQNERAQKAIRTCPLDRILIETDANVAHFADIEPNQNEPANLVRVFAGLAELRPEDPEALAKQLWKNSNLLFGSVL